MILDLHPRILTVSDRKKLLAVLYSVGSGFFFYSLARYVHAGDKKHRTPKLADTITSNSGIPRSNSSKGDLLN